MCHVTIQLTKSAGLALPPIRYSSGRLQVMAKERVFNIDIGSEVGRFFDDSSIPLGAEPRVVILMGGSASGKTTIRKQNYSTGYVLVDAAEIFLNLSRGEFFPFPEAFEEPMEVIGHLVARRAIAERRNIVTEIVGSSYDATNALIEALLAAGYRIEVQAITCELAEATRRNANREDDCISAYYAEPYQHRWLVKAAQHVKDPVAEESDQLQDTADATSILDHIGSLTIVVTREAVDCRDITGPLTTLRRLMSSVEIIRQFRERVDISFDGYNSTTDELWQIPAVHDYVLALDEQFPFWLYFLSRQSYGLQCIGLCMLPVFQTEPAPSRVHTEMLTDILNKRWEPALIRLCNSAGLADSVADELTRSAHEYFVHGPQQAAENT